MTNATSGSVTNKKPSKESQAIIWVARVLSLVMLVLAFCLLVRGDSTGGAVAGAIAFGLALFQHASYITELSGFGLTAKLQREVQQAEDTLEQMRSFALAFAKTSLLNLAWMNRMGTPSAKTVREQVESLDALLASLDVPERERRAAKQPFLSMVAWDLARGPIFAAMGLLTAYRKKAEAARDALPPGDHPQRAVLQAEVDRLQGDAILLKIDPSDPADQERLTQFPEELRKFLEGFGVVETEIEKLVQAARRAQKIMTTAIARGNRTEEAEDYIAKYTSHTGTLFEEVFGVGYSPEAQ